MDTLLTMISRLCFSISSSGSLKLSDGGIVNRLSEREGQVLSGLLTMPLPHASPLHLSMSRSGS